MAPVRRWFAELFVAKVRDELLLVVIDFPRHSVPLGDPDLRLVAHRQGVPAYRLHPSTG